MSQQTFTLPDGRAWALPEFVKTPAEAAERDRLLAGRFYLVRQGSLGEIFRCSRCKDKHRYLTLACCERPFSGITEGLFAYFQTAGNPQAMLRMTPAERARVESVRGLLDLTAGLPDVASSHPQLARRFGVGDRDIELGAVPLGLVEEIPASLAQRFQTRINMRGIKPPLSLPGLQS